jgi:hypothetical protein
VTREHLKTATPEITRREMRMKPFDRTTKQYDFKTTNWKSIGAVYLIMNAKGQTICVGQTGDLKRRMDEHRAGTKHAIHKYAPALVALSWSLPNRSALRVRPN